MFAEFAATFAVTGWAGTAGLAARYARRLHTDPLTGLGNRAALHRRVRRAVRNRGLLGALMVDLDQFKAINDTHGHDFGNKVLAAVAAQIAETARPGELAVRLHGDEFVLWLGRIPSPAHAERRADQLAEALAVPLWVEGRRITALGSVGLAVAPAATPISELLGQADAHMYEVKAHRRLTVLPTSPRRPRDGATPPDLAA